ncbi:MAG TPA: hypothetical protein VIS77_09770 [Burkholderiales bacterium]
MPARETEHRQRLEAGRRGGLVERFDPLRGGAIGVADQCRGGLRQPVCRGRDEDGLAGDAGPGVERLFEHRVSCHDDAKARLEARATLPEQGPPVVRAHQRLEGRVGAQDDGAAFVEDRQQVAQAASLPTLGGQARGVARIQRRLGARERKPGQRVEQVVPVLRPGAHLAAVVNAQLVMRAVERRRHEAQRVPARGARRDCGERVQPVAVRPSRSPRKPLQVRPNRAEDRVGKIGPLERGRAQRSFHGSDSPARSGTSSPAP